MSTKLNQKQKKSALHLAVENQYYDLSIKLLEFGADIRLKDNFGETPLHKSLKTCIKIRELMLSAALLEKVRSVPGAIDLQDHQGNTALHIVVQRSSTPNSTSSLVNSVLECNPNPKIKNLKGQTPIDIISNLSDKQKLLKLLNDYNNNYKNFVPIEEEEVALKIVKSKGIDSVRLPINAPSSKNDKDWELVNKFKEKLEEMLKNGLVDKEFEEIENATADDNNVGDFTSALQEYNLIKNRYRNILPYEKSRVKLKDQNFEGSDFISANWVSGETPGTEHAYIATQGPLQHTVQDFWRMIWEQPIKVIVMLSNLIENGREKVWQYWPDLEAEPLDTGDFLIFAKSYSKTEQLISRQFLLQNKKNNQKKTITHLQYIAWPDHGLPENTSGFSKIIDLVDEENTENSPVAVHCSAGIGRTGVFCVSHSILQKIRLLLWTSVSLDFDIKQTVFKVRENRAGMIQTKEQYTFCYLSLVERLTKLLDIMSYKNQRWFYNQQNAPNLRGKPNGTFLVHYQPTNQDTKVGHIVIAVSKGVEVQNFLCHVSEKGFTFNGTTYPSLVKLLESNPNLFKNPLYKQ